MARKVHSYQFQCKCKTISPTNIKVYFLLSPTNNPISDTIL